MSRFLLSLVLFCLASACAPRGEYKDVDTLLTLAKERYAKVANVETPAKEELVPLLLDLEKVITNKDLSAKIASSLRKLTPKAGFTSRPAISELVLQYDNIASNSSNLINEASLKLLTSRTLYLLASELETTAFKVS